MRSGIGNRESGIGTPIPRCARDEQGTGNSVSRTDRVEHRQEATPRVADEIQAIESQLVRHGGEVFNVGLPGDRRWVVGPRTAAAASRA